MARAWQGSCIITNLMMIRADRRILVVEDEKLLSWSLTKSLSKWGFLVHPVFTASEAMTQLKGSGFDVIILDYQLPDLDGLQVARCIRKAQPHAIILLVTAFQLNELAVEPGLIDAYFNKPIDFQQLQQTLMSIPHLSAEAVNAGGMQPLR